MIYCNSFFSTLIYCIRKECPFTQIECNFAPTLKCLIFTQSGELFEVHGLNIFIFILVIHLPSFVLILWVLKSLLIYIYIFTLHIQEWGGVPLIICFIFAELNQKYLLTCKAILYFKCAPECSEIFRSKWLDS